MQSLVSISDSWFVKPARHRRPRKPSPWSSPPRWRWARCRPAPWAAASPRQWRAPWARVTARRPRLRRRTRWSFALGMAALFAVVFVGFGRDDLRRAGRQRPRAGRRRGLRLVPVPRLRRALDRQLHGLVLRGHRRHEDAGLCAGAHRGAADPAQPARWRWAGSACPRSASAGRRWRPVISFTLAAFWMRRGCWGRARCSGCVGRPAAFAGPRSATS